MDFVELFQAVIGIAVSVIPEGLPAIITITLAIGVQRMAQRNAIIRRLPAVETLGSVSRICSDKTGTLTLMEMMVVSAVTADSEYQVSGDGYAPEGEVKQDGKPAGKDPVLELMGRVSMLCNDAELFQEEGTWKVEGDPTEGALYPFATKLGMDRQTEQAASPRIDAIPFESEHKFMATLHKPADGKELLFVKGAPEVILEHCDRQQTADGEPRPLDREHFMQASDKLAGQGERVLALAWLENPGVKAGSLGPADLPKNLVLLGLIGLLDPPRKEAIEAVKECHGGGIRVTMITGDHKITAAAIAKMLGIGDGKTAITGAEIEEMDYRDAAGAGARRRRVRAREPRAQAAPGEGDPGQQADRGDDGRRRERRAVAQEGRHRRRHGDQGHRGHQGGRRDDPRRRQLRLDHGGGEGRAHGLQQHREGDPVHAADQRRPGAGHRGRDLPRLHHADHGAAGPVGQHGDLRRARPGDLLRAARARRDERPPRAVDRPILTGFGIWRVVFVGLALLAFTLWAFFWMKSHGASDALARTVAVNAITIGQVFYLLNSRFLLDSSLSIRAHLGNRYLPLGIGAVVVLQLLFTYAPPLQRLFDNEAIPLWVWPWLLLGGLVFFLVVEAEKLIIRSSGSLRSAVTAVEAGATT